MSYGKFASVTASLLARKGEAAPWNGNGPAGAERFQEKRGAALRPEPVNDTAWRMEATSLPPAPRPPSPPPAMPAPVPRRVAAPADAVKRCTIRLSQQDYERLGIMAVKKDVTRQQFLQSALSRVLDEIAAEFPGGCACIGGNCGACR